jgi:hypothetical protein
MDDDQRQPYNCFSFYYYCIIKCKATKKEFLSFYVLFLARFRQQQHHHPSFFAQKTSCCCVVVVVVVVDDDVVVVVLLLVLVVGGLSDVAATRSAYGIK